LRGTAGNGRAGSNGVGNDGLFYMVNV
jgi:hypothetical protein